MKAVLDHIGIAIKDLDAALAFYRDALGLEVEAPEEVRSQQVRAHFVPVGDAKLELLEATAAASPIARFVGKRGPGLHHITLRVADVHAAVDRLKARGIRMIDETPRPGAEGSMIAFVHPTATHGVLVELKQARPDSAAAETPSMPLASQPRVQRYALGDLELMALSAGFVRFDAGSVFGVVPKALWSRRVASDERNRIRLAMRPLVVRGVRTLLIDAGVGEKGSARFDDMYGIDRSVSLQSSLAEAGLRPEDIDVVVASHLHFDHAGGFTMLDDEGHVIPAFPRAQYVVRRGEWEDATHPHARNRASYHPADYLPLAEAGVLLLVDEDQTIMPGVRVQRTGGHTMHHQVVRIESDGRTAAFAADLMPTTAHARDAWIMGYDLYPMDTLAAKQRFVQEAVDCETLVFFEHDPAITAGYLRRRGAEVVVEPVEGK
jgi:methylmalonyl-CoA epimerase